MPYIRVGIYSIDHVKECVTKFKNGVLPLYYKFNGYKVKLLSDRYTMFFEKGIVCVSCGIKGAYFALERSVNNNVYEVYKRRKFHNFLRWEREYQKSLNKKIFRENLELYHFNLYAPDRNGNEILMTKDHIIPKSKGGKNHISNYQPMCRKCNQEKANTIYTDIY